MGSLVRAQLGPQTKTKKALIHNNIEAFLFVANETFPGFKVIYLL
jgi:hypothetical protein